MAIHMFAHSSLASAPSARGIRVILCEPESVIRDLLRSFIDADPLLTLAAETREWRECESALQNFDPELLIARLSLIPSDWHARNDQDDSFPVVIALQSASTPEVGATASGSLMMPAAPDMVRRSLNQAVCDIYDRKAKQLLYLVDRYIAASNVISGYSSTLTVERDGKTIELRTSDILAIVAARKWVSVYALSGQFLLREPIHFLSAKLDPSIFIRIHRSIIISYNYVDHKIPNSPRSPHVVLVDGSRHPVGPNYRDALSQAIQRQSHCPSSLYRSVS